MTQWRSYSGLISRYALILSHISFVLSHTFQKDRQHVEDLRHAQRLSQSFAPDVTLQPIIRNTTHPAMLDSQVFEADANNARVELRSAQHTIARLKSEVQQHVIRFDAQAAEVGQLVAELKEQQRRVKSAVAEGDVLRAKVTSLSAQAASPPNLAVDDSALVELRGRIRHLEAQIRASELLEVELRSELDRTQKVVQAGVEDRAELKAGMDQTINRMKEAATSRAAFFSDKETQWTDTRRALTRDLDEARVETQRYRYKAEALQTQLDEMRSGKSVGPTVPAFKKQEGLDDQAGPDIRLGTAHGAVLPSACPEEPSEGPPQYIRGW